MSRGYHQNDRRVADVAARARAEMRSLETAAPVGWDAGDGVVILTQEELAALAKWCLCERVRGLIVDAVRGWARRIPPRSRKRAIIDWLIECEAKMWDGTLREIEAEDAAKQSQSAFAGATLCDVAVRQIGTAIAPASAAARWWQLAMDGGGALEPGPRHRPDPDSITHYSG
jgi:hypothetical protein